VAIFISNFLPLSVSKEPSLVPKILPLLLVLRAVFIG
jgi:hypothetical protein